MINLAQKYNGIVLYNPSECRCIMDLKTVELIKKDLEELENLKKIIGTPIQELMNKLKELETVKSFVVDYTAFYDTGCCLDEYIYYDSEIGRLFKKWNEE